MHSGGSMNNEDTKYEGEAKQREVNSLVPECHVFKWPQPLIHIETGVTFLVGILLFRHFRGLVVLAFTAVYAIVFLVFMGLIFPGHSIRRGFGSRGTKSTLLVIQAQLGLRFQWFLMLRCNQPRIPRIYIHYCHHRATGTIRVWIHVYPHSQLKMRYTSYGSAELNQSFGLFRSVCYSVFRWVSVVSGVVIAGLRITANIQYFVQCAWDIYIRKKLMWLS